MVLTRKTKCSECKALRRQTNEQGEDSYVCILGHLIDFKVKGRGVDRVAYAPSPNEKCYKPTTQPELRKAKTLLDQAKEEKNA